MQAIRPPGQEYRERFLVQQGTELRSIAISDTAYFYAEDKVVLSGGDEWQKYILDNSLDKLESGLDPEQFSGSTGRSCCLLIALTACSRTKKAG